VLLGAAAALIVPEIDEGKQRGAERERRERARAIRAEERRLRLDQRVQRGRATPADSLRERRGLAGKLERAITRDARTRRGLGPVAYTTCSASADERDLRRRRGLYKCLAVTLNSRTPKGLALETGYPFVAQVDYRSGRYAWCKTNPRPGEKAGEGLAHLPLSRECAGRLRDVL
jgi:hypothetical protein